MTSRRHLSSPTQTGTITEDEDFYPRGGEVPFLNSDSNHYKFTGKERDTETGLDYFGARYYGNWTGRFLTPDWAAKPITVPYANFGNPQSLNLYSNTKNNPTTFGDPDGHQCPGCADPDTLAVEMAPVVLSQLWNATKSLWHSMTSGPPPTDILHPNAPQGTCICPEGTNQKNDSKNSNSSYQQNNEQGRDAEGKFVSKQPGQTAPGADAEKQGLDSVGAVKNKNEVLNGTKRDGTIPETGQHVEVKSGESVSNTQQLQNMGQAAVDATGQPLKVVTTNPNVTVSRQAQQNKNLKIEPMK